MIERERDQILWVLESLDKCNQSKVATRSRYTIFRLTMPFLHALISFLGITPISPTTVPSTALSHPSSFPTAALNPKPSHHSFITHRDHQSYYLQDTHQYVEPYNAMHTSIPVSSPTTTSRPPPLLCVPNSKWAHTLWSDRF